jgi:sulfotransferase famil protein
MIISQEKKFVVFAPWKTASSTLHRRLERYNESRYSRFYYFNTCLQRVVTQHVTCAEFRSFPESNCGYFLASFVRNPYDRVYSGFLQLKRDAQTQPLAPYPERWIKNLVMQQVADNFRQLCSAGFDFDRWLDLVQEHQIYEVGHNTSFRLHPSHYWTHFGGKQMVDFIGKVENFEIDFETLCSKIGVVCGEKINKNVTNEESLQENPPNRSRYLSLMSAASIRKINQLFKADFDLFGYEVVSPDL